MLKAVSDVMGRACTPIRIICWKTWANLKRGLRSKGCEKNPIKNLRVQREIVSQPAHGGLFGGEGGHSCIGRVGDREELVEPDEVENRSHLLLHSEKRDFATRRKASRRYSMKVAGPQESIYSTALKSTSRKGVFSLTQLCNSERSSGEACRSTSPDTLSVVTPFSLDFSICMQAK